MFEVLVYVFENYLEADIRPDQSTLANELSAAGFDKDDIDGAFDWLSTLEAMTSQPDAPGGDGIRIYSAAERKKISAGSLGSLTFLQQAGILDACQRELVIDRAMALPQPEVGPEEMRWIILMALWNQGRTGDYLFVEDAVFDPQRPTLH